jgi:hypothetical protein
VHCVDDIEAIPCRTVIRASLANQRDRALPANFLNQLSLRLLFQEQIQIITRAIGRPTAKVPAIVNANAESKFASA